uniref:Transmembrane protein 243, mitochondrial a n=1 Tax=Neogobius melanostomus TaxID=47308 RepID=A0A8C6U2U3_9GOBI
MDDFTTRTYGTSGGLDNRPLFGETSARDRIINLVVGGFASSVVLVTIISSFVFPSTPPRPLNVFFAVCILLTCGSTIVCTEMKTSFLQVIMCRFKHWVWIFSTKYN